MKINRKVYQQMLAAARDAAPLEACGLLGGAEGKAKEFYELTNIDKSGEHYSMIPEEQFAAVKDMRSKKLNMVAIWHSHPATPARMSEEDMRLAFTPDVVYLILSLADSGKPEIRGFAVENNVPKEVQLEIEER